MPQKPTRVTRLRQVRHILLCSRTKHNTSLSLSSLAGFWPAPGEKEHIAAACTRLNCGLGLVAMQEAQQGKPLDLLAKRFELVRELGRISVEMPLMGGVL